MSSRTTSAIAAVLALVVLGAAGVGASRLFAPRQRATVTFTDGGRIPPVLARHAIGGDRRWRLSADQVQRAFVGSYARFLDGHGRASRLTDASITAQGQARRAGRIPGEFRDGPLAVRSIRDTGYSDYSATAQMVLADRQERYPLTIGLLREMGAGWLVTDIDPPDLSIDHPFRQPPATPIPLAVRQAAHGFAAGYVAAHDRTRGPMPAMTATARREVADSEDPLSGHRLPGSHATVAALAYGPLEGDEIAVTATVRNGQTVRFSFLLTRTAGRWSCDAFL
jgi:hypothetical protein